MEVISRKIYRTIGYIYRERAMEAEGRLHTDLLNGHPNGILINYCIL